MRKKVFGIAGIICLLLWIILIPYIKGYTYDLNCWINWADTIRQNGLENVYNGDTNYLPLYHYVLWAFAKVAPDRSFLVHHVFVLRYITLLADLAGLWLLYQWTDRKWSFPLILLITLGNLAYVYDDIIWGQVDGILATLAFAAMYYAYKGDWLKGTIFAVLMVNFKLQGIVFVPLFLLLLAGQFKVHNWPKLILKSILAAVIVQSIVLLPFLLKPGGLMQIGATLAGLVGYVPKVSSLAFNCWSFILGAQADHTPDGNIFILGMNYKQIGLLLFMISSLVSLWPMLRFVYQKSIKGMHISIPKEQVWIMAALIAIGFFYFNTQMHERYSYPAFIFIAAYAFYRKDFIPYILFSVAFFMNMEYVLRWLHLDNYKTAIFDRRLIAALYGITMIYLWYRLYRGSFSNKNIVKRLKTAA